MGVGSGSRVPLDFHTWYNIVDGGLIVLFFGLFFVAPLSPQNRINSAIFPSFFLLRPPPPGKFSAIPLVDAGCS